MDKWILKALLLFIILGAFTLVVSGGRFCNNPTPPLCADDCNGNGYYLNEGGTECIQCPTCPAGQELNKACGNGMNGDAVCRACPNGFFSTSTSRHCSPCSTCINTVELKACQGTQDRECGDCIPGFARSSDRFSADPNACPDMCSDLPRDAPQCRDWWSEQAGEPIATEPLESPPEEQPVPVEPLDGPDACEPQPPRCIDPCYDENYFLGSDGLCKVCLQCQPGEQLNKVCGRGKNGDAYCQRCPEGTFSEDGIGRCIPCRICVNAVATECTAIRDSECGDCLPGYYQDAVGFFPDKGACPNKCMECPTTIPQCQEWCESKVTTSAIQPSGQDAVSPQAVADLDDIIEQDAVLHPAVAGYQNDADKEEINVAAGSTPANHASYTTIFIVLASLLTVIIVILIIVLGVFRHFWKKTDRSNLSSTESPLLSRSSRAPSPASLPRGSPSTVYRPTTYEPVSEDPWEYRHYLGASIFSSLTGERPISGSSADSDNRSSAASTPTMSLNRLLANMDPRGHMERQNCIHPNGSSRSNPQDQPQNPRGFEEGNTLDNSASRMCHAGPLPPSQLVASRSSDQEQRPNERSGNLVSSSGRIFTEEAPGHLNPHEEDKDNNPGSQVRRRSSGKIFLENNSGTVHPRADDQDGALGSQVRRRSSGKVFLEHNSGTVHPRADDQDGALGSQVRRRSSGKIFLENNSGAVHPHADDQDGALGSQVRRRSSGKNLFENNSGTVHAVDQDGPAGSQVRRRSSGSSAAPVGGSVRPHAEVSNGNTLPEQEPVAELFPTDSSSDDGHTPDIQADTSGNKTADKKHQGQPSGPNTASRATATDSVVPKPRSSKRSSLGVLPENSPTETIPEKESSPLNVGNPGNKSSNMIRNTSSMSSGEQSVTININMNTNGVGNFHVGDVHNSHNYPHQITTGSENQDKDDEEDVSERLLNITTSENDTIPEPKSCSDEDDEKDNEEDNLLDTE